MARFPFLVISALAALAVFQASAAKRAFGVPAWARKTGLPCASCHFGGTSRLTETGRDFQIRGHRFKSDDGDLRGSKLMDYLSLATKVRSANARPSSPGAASAVQTWEVFAGGPLSREFSFFGEYVLFDRVPGRARGTSGFLDGYVQYTGSASSADDFWWARSGRLYPFAVYALGAGGRTTLSRSRLVTDKVSGLLPSLHRRSFGVAVGGYSARTGLRLEAGVQRGNGGAQNGEDAPSPFAGGPDVFVTAEKRFDAPGTSLGLYARTGRLDPSGAGNGEPGRRFTQSGVLGRHERETFALTGAYIAGRMRDASGHVRNPDGYFLEAARNLRPELTGFVRYDSLAAGAAAGANVVRSRQIVLGVSQRLPGSGRIVFEWGRDLSTGAAPARRTALLDVVVMY